MSDYSKVSGYKINTQKSIAALAGVAQWTECLPANQRVAGLIPSQGTCMDYRPGPQLGCARGNHTLMFLSLPFSLPSSLSLKKKKKSQLLSYIARMNS